MLVFFVARDYKLSFVSKDHGIIQTLIFFSYLFFYTHRQRTPLSKELYPQLTNHVLFLYLGFICCKQENYTYLIYCTRINNWIKLYQ